MLDRRWRFGVHRLPILNGTTPANLTRQEQSGASALNRAFQSPAASDLLITRSGIVPVMVAVRILGGAGVFLQPSYQDRAPGIAGMK